MKSFIQGSPGALRVPPVSAVEESTLHLVLRLRGGVIEPSLAVLARKPLGPAVFGG
jgi:hypothetical protein